MFAPLSKGGWGDFLLILVLAIIPMFAPLSNGGWGDFLLILALAIIPIFFVPIRHPGFPLLQPLRVLDTAIFPAGLFDNYRFPSAVLNNKSSKGCRADVPVNHSPGGIEQFSNLAITRSGKIIVPGRQNPGKTGVLIPLCQLPSFH